MKLAQSRSAALALLVLAGCAPRKTLTPLSGLEPLEPLSFCLPRAMHAVRALAPRPAGGGDAAAEEAWKKQAFIDYYESFLDAKEQTKYVACLKKNKHSKEYATNFREKYRQAKSWLKRSQEEVDRHRSTYPRGKRIVDVEEHFTDIDAKRGGRRVVITLRDGTWTVVETQFDKSPAP